jgi:hypothetical protein
MKRKRKRERERERKKRCFKRERDKRKENNKDKDMTFFSRGSRCRCVNDGPKRELRRKRGGERVVSFV